MGAIQNARFKHVLALSAILILAALVLHKLMFMLSAFLGAAAFYILLRRPHKYLVRRFGWRKPATTALLLLLSICLLLLPNYLMAVFFFNKLKPLMADPQPITDALQKINAYINQYVEFSIISEASINKISALAQQILPAILDSGLNMISNLVMMYFLLWFMLNNSFALERWIRLNSPYSRKDTLELLRHIQTSVFSNATGIVLLGIIQGIVAMIGYAIFGVHEPVLWGLITGAVSVIPFVGTMLAYIPLSFYLMATGAVANGIGVLCFGLFIIGSSDNVFRFLLQKRMASTHPLITVLGVIIGLSLLGFWGLIYGPLMVSLLLELGKRYKNEYLGAGAGTN